MTNLLILGAHGQIARVATELFLNKLAMTPGLEIGSSLGVHKTV